MSVCVNHPGRAATSRCSSCHKPICDDCIVKSEGAVFCSQACQENAARFAKNFRPEMGPGFFGNLKNMIVSLAGLAVVLLVVVFGCAKILKIAFFVDLLSKFGL
jgi:hypothetical protein